jgi:cytochrome c biogenesis protein CcmG/thiol:disulfide interchange protein DsbE
MVEEAPAIGKSPDSEDRKFHAGRITVWVFVGITIVFLAAGLLQVFQSQPTNGKAPDFTLTTYNGNRSYTLSELRGQVVVVNFWASWCTSCAEEADDLERAWQEYRDDGVIFLGVAYVDSEAKALEYLEQYNVSYPNGPDLRSKISDAYSIRGVPETFIIDRNGEIVYFAMEPLSYAQLSAEIEKAMAQ